jgi:hypothetical protein
VVKGQAIRRNDATAGQQAMLFLQNLTEAVNQQRSAAMVYSLQASVGEAVQEEGLLHALEHISARIDARRAPVTGDEVLRVVQRRLFDSVGDEAVRREVARSYGSLLRSELEATAETDDARREASRVAADLERRVEESYPFHSELLDLMNQRWGSLPTYQRTRGALQFLATVVHALWSARSERTPQALIGPGDSTSPTSRPARACSSRWGSRPSTPQSSTPTFSPATRGRDRSTIASAVKSPRSSVCASVHGWPPRSCCSLSERAKAMTAGRSSVM